MKIKFSRLVRQVIEIEIEPGGEDSDIDERLWREIAVHGWDEEVVYEDTTEICA